VATALARTPVPAVAGGGTSGGTSVGTTGAGGAPASSAVRTDARAGSTRPSDASGGLLRITELLPDPVQEGVDAEYEWVELANFGTEPANLEGLVLQENVGRLTLPPLSLDPGGVLVVAASRADTGAAALVHLLEGVLGNGLGNGGDRLALLTPEGAVLDAVSWGSDRTYLEGLSAVPAPGPGRSLLRLFTDDGSLVAVERLDVPTPGRADDSLVRIGETEVPPPSEAALGRVGARGWMALVAIGAVFLAWTLVLRAREAQRAAA
jgi:hypothetical protein